MDCPYCNGIETKVIDSRESKDRTSIKRRRECLKCQKRFSTIEKVLKLDIEILKSNGDVEEFSLGKIRKSLLKCCEKRPITLEQIDNLLDEVLNDLKKIENKSLHTSEIGEIVLKNLKEIDEIAFLRYAIVHNNYSSIKDFLDEIEVLKGFEGLNYKKKDSLK